MNTAKMRRHLAGAEERQKAEEERWRALFESGVMTKHQVRILNMPTQATFQPFAARHRLPSVRAASRPTVEPTPTLP